MSIKPSKMVVTFDDPAEMERITRLFTHYYSAFERSGKSKWPFNIKPPVIVMFGIEYAITQLDQDCETIGYRNTTLACLDGGRVIQPTLTVTLERV